MYPRRRYIELAFVLLISLSGILLGISHDNQPLLWTAVIGSILSFLLVDYFRFFHLSGWLANIASILILLYAMRDFLDGDTAVKLVSVAMLLVYLQCVLIFQRKTPRIYWQVFVLSFLQIVVAAIFNLNFEGSILFASFFAVALIAMMLQNDFSVWYSEFGLNHQNLASEKTRQSELRAGQHIQMTTRPCLVSPQRDRHYFSKMLFQTVPWVIGSLFFAVVLFYMIPRAEDAWVGPGLLRVTGTGMSHRAQLNERGRVDQSDSNVFRASFVNRKTGENFELREQPYFRGMPLPRYAITDGHTDWKAPYDSVFEHSYRPLRFFRSISIAEADYGTTANLVNQTIVQDGTADPLLYVCMPPFKRNDKNDDAEFCHDLSALSRRRKGDFTELSSFKYETVLAVDPSNKPLGGWPYVPNGGGRPLTLEQASGERAGLVHLEPQRYPSLVSEAKKVVDSANTTNTIEVSRAMLEYFQQPGLFDYTIDFRNVPRQDGVDAVEDFFANHRSGHCQLFASALVLMLRSQNIPARYVVGFHGGEFNSLTESYMVRTTHAHAWVEAYVSPEHCTDEMRNTGMAGPGGCWLTLDPTPPTDSRNGNDALDLARTLWDDYVMSVDQNQQNEIMAVSTAGISGFFHLGKFRAMFDRTFLAIRNSPLLQGILIFVIFAFVLLIVFFNRRKLADDKRASNQRKKVGVIRRFVADTLTLISPRLGAMLLEESDGANQIVPFYVRMRRALERAGIQKTPQQTHLEFAKGAAQQLQHLDLDGTDANNIESAIHKITDVFYHVRFGNLALDDSRLQEIERTVDSLELAIKGFKRKKRSP